MFAVSEKVLNISTKMGVSDNNFGNKQKTSNIGDTMFGHQKVFVQPQTLVKNNQGK